MNDVADATVTDWGSIGRAIEARLAPFGEVFARARSSREGVASVSRLDQPLDRADIVVLTMPLTSGTRHLMNAKRLAKIKPGTLLVNAARGAIVDTESLLTSIE